MKICITMNEWNDADWLYDTLAKDGATHEDMEVVTDRKFCFLRVKNKDDLIERLNKVLDDTHQDAIDANVRERVVGQAIEKLE